jgi:hypothetical protein
MQSERSTIDSFIVFAAIFSFIVALFVFIFSVLAGCCKQTCDDNVPVAIEAAPVTTKDVPVFAFKRVRPFAGQHVLSTRGPQ